MLVRTSACAASAASAAVDCAGTLASLARGSTSSGGSCCGLSCQLHVCTSQYWPGRPPCQLHVVTSQYEPDMMSSSIIGR